MCYVALIPVAIALFSGMKQSQNAKVQGGAAAANARLNAGFANRAAEDATKRGAYEADLQRIKTSQMIGTQRSAGASNGGDINDGSNALIQEDTAALGELDALTIQNNAAREAYGYKVQALTGNLNAKSYESNAKEQSKASILGGVVNAAGAYFGGGMGGFGGGATGGYGQNMQGQSQMLNNSAYVSRL